MIRPLLNPYKLFGVIESRANIVSRLFSFIRNSFPKYVFLSISGSLIANKDDVERKYRKINEKIELISKLTYFVFFKFCAPGVALLAQLIAIVNYFVLDLGDESFYLPLPVM